MSDFHKATDPIAGGSSDSAPSAPDVVGDALSVLGTSTGAAGAQQDNISASAAMAAAASAEDGGDTAFMPDVDPSSIRAVWFDLDGTLLPMDLDEFLGKYFKSIGEFVQERGFDGHQFSAGFSQGMKAMAHHEPDQTNSEAFWEEFFKHADPSLDWQGTLIEYYTTVFPRIGEGVVPNPAAARAVTAFADKGYPVVLATMPYFPLPAVRVRLSWTGVPERLFLRLTHYENSCAAKPSTYYYAENLAACGLRGEDVLMVGNNTVEDLSFSELGAPVFIATDWLINPVNMGLANVPHGTMEQFADWAESLPPCANPATSITEGRIERAASEKALEDNLHREGM